MHDIIPPEPEISVSDSDVDAESQNAQANARDIFYHYRIVMHPELKLERENKEARERFR